MLFATMIKGEGQDRYLMAEKDGAVVVTQVKSVAIDGIEESYNRAHNRGYEASMSACIHFLFFNPVIVPIPDAIEEVKSLIDFEAGLFSLGHISGYYHGWKLKPEAVTELLKKEIKPRLISEETYKE